MMLLRSSPFSPFGRKVKIAAHLVGLMPLIEVLTADTLAPDDPLRADNPLGKLPVLVPEDGVPIYDSRVILSYLDLRSGGGRLIPMGATRLRVETLQALADGIMDASILRMYEIRFRDEAQRSPKWIEHQAGKVDRGLAALEATPPAVDDVTVGGIAVACALGYLDLRFQGAWRASHPKLVAWLDAWAARVPAFEATKPPPA
jgi:glutathione S-transferase